MNINDWTFEFGKYYDEIAVTNSLKNVHSEFLDIESMREIGPHKHEVEYSLLDQDGGLIQGFRAVIVFHDNGYDVVEIDTV